MTYEVQCNKVADQVLSSVEKLAREKNMDREMERERESRSNVTSLYYKKF